jgi:hypothetical protein
MNNLQQLRPPSEQRAFQVPYTPTGPVKIVCFALKKYLTSEQYNTVIHDYRRSDSSAEALQRDFMRCNSKYHEVIKDDYYYQALEITRTMFKPTYLCRPVHFCDLRYYPWTLSTSVEAPFSTNPDLIRKVAKAKQAGLLETGKMNFHNLYNHVFEYNRPLVHLIKDGKAKGNKFMYWNTAHARSHLVKSSDPDKIRMVHGVPKITLMVELMLLWTYFNFLRAGTTPIAWGYETLKGGWYKLHKEASSHTPKISTWLALDWRMFDKLARYSVIDDVHDMWLSYLSFDNGYIPTRDYRNPETQPHRLNNLWKWMCNAVKFTPIRLPDGSEWKRNHSTIASGLLQTQVLDTFVNAIMLITCLLAMGFNVTSRTFIKLLGDDSLIGLEELVPKEDFLRFLKDLATEAMRRFGAVLNVSKSGIFRTLNEANFLGYHNRNSIPYRDELALLSQLAYPERHWDIHRLAARAIGIAWASCGQSDIVYNVCQDVYQFCMKCGATPNPIGHSFLEFMMTVDDIDLTAFPTRAQLSANLCSEPSPSPQLDEEFFPMKHFTARF